MLESVVEPCFQHIVPASYDRSASLTELEKYALAEVAKRAHQSKHARKLHLDRLIQPLLDVLKAYEPDLANPKSRQRRDRTITPFLRMMHLTGKSFWGWSYVEWETFLAEQRCGKQHGFAVAYVLCGVSDPGILGRNVKMELFATRLLGSQVMDELSQVVGKTLIEWGYRPAKIQSTISATASAMLSARITSLDAFDSEILRTLRADMRISKKMRGSMVPLARVLNARGLLAKGEPKFPFVPRDPKDESERQNLPLSPEWERWCQRWFDTSSHSRNERLSTRTALKTAGRWLHETHPEISSPAEWTREIAAEYVAAVTKMRIGDYINRRTVNFRKHWGKPLMPATKLARLRHMKTVLEDCQEWGWIERKFNPATALRTPYAVRTAIGPNPRVIDQTIWAKLMNAGLTLGPGDIPRWRGHYMYPFEMVKAIAVVWLFAGIRRNSQKRVDPAYRRLYPACPGIPASRGCLLFAGYPYQ